MLPLHSTSKVYLKFCLIFARPRLSEAGSLTRPVWNHCVSVKFSWDLVCDVCLCVCWSVEQLPTITAQSPGAVIALPFEESFTVSCEAKANPEPEWVVLYKPQLVSLKKNQQLSYLKALFQLRFRWTKNGREFDPSLDPLLRTEESSGTFVIPNNGNLTEYQGTYRCFASNKLGTTVSQEIEFIVPSE